MSPQPIPACIEETQSYLPYLCSYDYSLQDAKIQSLISSSSSLSSFPLSSRFSIRAMTPEDIPACAHLVTHSFGDRGVLLLIYTYNICKCNKLYCIIIILYYNYV